MYSRLKTIGLAASVSLLALTHPLTAGEMPDVSEIAVEASLDAAQDGNAAVLLPTLGADLQAAIAARVPTSDNAADPVIRVDVRKIALDGDTVLPDTAEFNEIEGIVVIDSSSSNGGGQTFPVLVKAATADTVAPEGYVLVAPSTGDFYTAMVEAFAGVVAERLKDVDL